eukprot:CAMPEP_0177607666 /NCGR_PEP_ID=MMETSP0419_2-20121207/18043_1 /TAXON_ID=582737 /ORGANISM="Tetraselmis sp., Strain GSL018" /LENGTH=621 /DNA_ID=CAMNT_0019102271 /DNA_START=825 /DNA_END=2690 /DNA_ORIENTATION=+
MAIAKALSQNTVLGKLDLRVNNIDSQAASALAKALERNKSLGELQLDGNKIGNHGAGAFANLLRNNATLEWLSLRGSNIGPQGAQDLALVLKGNSSLKGLYLGGNKIRDNGAMVLADALRFNIAIEEFDVSGNKIGSLGITALAEALRHNAVLKKLDLGENGIRDSGGEVLLKGLKENAVLQELCLNGNRITNDMERSVQAALAVPDYVIWRTQTQSPLPQKSASADSLNFREQIEVTANESHEHLREEATGSCAAIECIEAPQQIKPTAPAIEDSPSDCIRIRTEEIPYQDLHIQGSALGSGSSKTVYRARWHDQDVAVLTLRSGEANSEATVFERLGRHPRLTRFLGMSRDLEGHRVIITEFAAKGSLDKVLADLEEEGRAVSCLVLMQCAMQVCEAMEQMVEEGLIHRDLALRNVLVFSFDVAKPRAVRLKVTDYGLTREGNYYYGNEEAVPVRWMPPEALKKRRWSEKSDVWAFGVLLWELWSAADLPYAFVTSDREVARLVTGGERLDRPNGCPDNVFALMQRCWKDIPSQRPTFRELRAELLDLYAYELAGAKISEDVHQGVQPGSDCVICFDARACMVLVPCGHQCSCQKCVQILHKCPICRAAVSERLRVYQP